MKKFMICALLITFFFNLFTYAQEDKKNKWDVNYSINYNQEAHYPGGDQALYSYIFNNFRYSDEAVEKRISGNAMVSFDIMPDSTISNIVILSSPGFGTSEELIRLLKTMKFAPAVLEGKPREQNIIITVPLRAYRRENKTE